MPLLIAAWIARVKGRDGWVGVFLGIATAFKFYPAVLVPALWRPSDDRGRRRAAWVMPLAFTFFIAWEPHLWVPWIEFAPLYMLLLSSRFVSKTA